MQPDASREDLRSDIKPVCPFDNAVMGYEPTHLAMRDPFRASVIDRFLPSYGCRETACPARFRHVQGYFTLKGVPEFPKVEPIPGVNIAKCPKHGYWLYMRARTGSEKNVAWCCAVPGCDHVQYTSDVPGTWAR